MFEQAFRNIDDVLRKEAGCTTELDYTEQSSWLLFLKYLDGLEADKATEAALDGKKYSFKIKNMGNAGRNGGEYYTPRPTRQGKDSRDTDSIRGADAAGIAGAAGRGASGRLSRL